MSSLIAILVVAFLVLGLLLAAVTLFLQGYLYNEPVSAIYWRAPAAAAALTLFLSLWVALDYRSILDRNDSEGRYQPLFNYSLPYETITYEHLWVTSQNRGEEYFVRRGNEYVRPGGRRLPTHPLQVVVSHTADGEKHVFKPERDARGNFKAGKDEVLRYYEDGDTKKRSMSENYLGQINIFHFGWLVVALLLHFGFLLVWFVSLWLLLRFQWPHALGLALGLWLIGLVILPSILASAEKVRKERLPTKTTTTASRLPRTRSRWLEAGMTQRFDRSGYEHQPLLFVDRVVYFQRANKPDPKLGRFQRQIAQRFAELRIDAEMVINLRHGRAHLGTEPPLLRPTRSLLSTLRTNSV